MFVKLGRKDAKDDLKVKGSEVFLLIRDGYGRTVLNNNFS